MDVQDEEGNNGQENSELWFTPPETVSQSDHSTDSDTGNTPCHSSKKKLQSILDKSISVDEDSLIAPLEPIRLSPIVNNKYDRTLEMRPHLVSILRTGKSYDDVHAFDEDNEAVEEVKRVSFPHDDLNLTTIREPEVFFPFTISEQLSAQDILTVYQESCKQNNTIELEAIKSQITEIGENTNRSAILKLNNVGISLEVVETVEDLFKVANFSTMSIVDCKLTPASIAVLLDLIEYYEPTSELIVSVDLDILEGWKLFANMIAVTTQIESVCFKAMTFSEANMRIFMTAVGDNTTVHTLKFDSCTLTKLPNFLLIDSLQTNLTIRELYLPQTGLYTREADLIGKFLTVNVYLKLLDISNNVIGDRGLEKLLKGLCKQKEKGTGLSVLIIFNNQLTEKSGKTLSKIIGTCKNLRCINIGFNKLTDSVLCDIKENLKRTECLEGLGLQSTVLTCIGATSLAEAIDANKSLEKINLKGNKAIYIDGLDKLSTALINSKITKFDLDETNRSCSDRDGYIELVTKIKGICAVNKTRATEEEEAAAPMSRKISRKTSLDCEPYYSIPSSIPSSCGGPASRTRSRSRSRFQVSKVPDSCPNKSINSSRFNVVAVTGDIISITTVEDYEVQQFQNVRSSVSSLDSVDSLTISGTDISYSPTSFCDTD